MSIKPHHRFFYFVPKDQEAAQKVAEHAYYHDIRLVGRDRQDYLAEVAVQSCSHEIAMEALRALFLELEGPTHFGRNHAFFFRKTKITVLLDYKKFHKRDLLVKGFSFFQQRRSPLKRYRYQSLRVAEGDATFANLRRFDGIKAVLKHLPGIRNSPLPVRFSTGELFLAEGKDGRQTLQELILNEKLSKEIFRGVLSCLPISFKTLSEKFLFMFPPTAENVSLKKKYGITVELSPKSGIFFLPNPTNEAEIFEWIEVNLKAMIDGRWNFSHMTKEGKEMKSLLEKILAASLTKVEKREEILSAYHQFYTIYQKFLPFSLGVLLTQFLTSCPDFEDGVFFTFSEDEAPHITLVHRATIEEHLVDLLGEGLLKNPEYTLLKEHLFSMLDLDPERRPSIGNTLEVFRRLSSSI